MTTRLFLCCALPLIGSIATNSFAQTQPDAAPATDALKIRYDNTVEYVNCRLAEYSVQHAKNAVLSAEFTKKCHCNPDGGSDANLKRFFKERNMGKNALIFNTTDSLKLAYKAGVTGRELSDRLTGFLASTKLVGFGSSKPDFPQFTRELSAEIENRFVGTTAPTPTTTAPTSGETSSTPDPIQNATETSESAISKFITYFIVFLLGVLAGALLLRFWQRKKNESNRQKSTTQSDDNSPNTKELERQITALQGELENQKKLSTQLRTQLQKAQFSTTHDSRTAASYITPPVDTEMIDPVQTITASETIDLDVTTDRAGKFTTDHLDIEKTEATIEFEIQQSQPLSDEPHEARLFFLRLPTRDGLFNDMRKSETFRPAESVYRMELLTKNRARFAVVSDEETMQRAIQGYNMYLEPACELYGEMNTNAVIIRTLEEGEAVKEGDIWRVTQKAVIDLA